MWGAREGLGLGVRVEGSNRLQSGFRSELIV